MKYSFKLTGARGFSIAELMVAIVIGMLALVFATRLLLSSEDNKDVSLGGSDSMQNGMQAMLSIKNDMEQAGFGLNDPLINGCDAVFHDEEGFELAMAQRGGTDIRPLTAVVIEPGAGSDTVSVYSGTSSGGTGTVGMTSGNTAGGVISLDRVPFGFRRNDVVVAVNVKPAQNIKCKVTQIRNDPDINPDAPSVDLSAGTRFDSSSVENPTYFANKSRLFNLGQADDLSFHTWSVSGHFLTLRATNLDGTQVEGRTVVENVVAIKAQYGFDTRPAAQFSPDSGMQQTGMRVNVWNPLMIDADGDGTVGDRDDWARVSAVRLAVVARGRNVERPRPGQACEATQVAPTLFASAEPDGVAPVETIISLAVAGDSVDWKCYRYRVFETIVPLRNGGWRPTATRPTKS